MGGWIETYENLSQENTAWVFGDAGVYGDALATKEVINLIELDWGSKQDIQMYDYQCYGGGNNV